MKFDQDGNVLWVNSFGGSGNDVFYAAMNYANGEIHAFGATTSNNGDMAGLSKGAQDAVMVVFDSNGPTTLPTPPSPTPDNMPSCDDTMCHVFSGFNKIKNHVYVSAHKKASVNITDLLPKGYGAVADHWN